MALNIICQLTMTLNQSINLNNTIFVYFEGTIN